MAQKLCPDCNIEKSTDDFMICKRIMARCKLCQNALRCKKRKESKAKAENITKMCKKCNISKEINLFRKYRNSCRCIYIWIK